MSCSAAAIVAFAVASVMPIAAVAAPAPLPLPISAPASPLSSILRDALTAIEQTAARNPAAAQQATFSYNAAVEQYNAHQYEQARSSALTAIQQSAMPTAPLAHAPLAVPAAAAPNYFIIPDELPATPANAQRYVTLAHRALAKCTAPKAGVEYRGAVSALGAKHYRVAMADARNIVDDCSGG